MSSPVRMCERHNGTAGDERIGASVERVAVRFVRTWGFSTVETVAFRLRLTTRAPLPRAALTRRALATLADVAWLDPAQEWFTLLDRDSAMRAAVEKIVSTVGAVEHRELELALGKRHSFGAAPPAVVHAYIVALASRIARERPCSEVSLSPGELVVLEAFDRPGSAATVEELRARTRHRLASTALARVLQTSPLFLRAARGAYRIVGSTLFAATPALIPSRRWQPAL